MSERDEWLPPKEKQADFATNTEDGIDWSRREQEQQPYEVPSQLSVEWGSDEYIRTRLIPVADYQGPYDVTPKSSAQTLGTANKYLKNDVTVAEVPYFVTSNESGGMTVSILS